MRAHSLPILIAVIFLSGAVFAESDWTSVDIGTSTAGSTTAVGDTGFQVQASGRDIWDSTDGFRMVYRSVSGDFSIRARVESISTPANPWAKAGVMIRQSTDPGSMQAMMVATPQEGGNGYAFQWRSEANGGSSHAGGGASAYPNSWVRLVRLGGMITAYKATDAAGLNFEPVGSPLPLSTTGPVLVGLCVTAHDDGQLCTATFDGVQLHDIPQGSGTV